MSATWDDRGQAQPNLKEAVKASISKSQDLVVQQIHLTNNHC